jgi:hypothetical protein
MGRSDRAVLVSPERRPRIPPSFARSIILDIRSVSGQGSRHAGRGWLTEGSATSRVRSARANHCPPDVCGSLSDRAARRHNPEPRTHPRPPSRPSTSPPSCLRLALRGHAPGRAPASRCLRPTLAARTPRLRPDVCGQPWPGAPRGSVRMSAVQMSAARLATTARSWAPLPRQPLRAPSIARASSLGRDRGFPRRVGWRPSACADGPSAIGLR